MKELNKLLLLCISYLFFLTSCEKVIQLPLKEVDPILVVEGAVTNLETQQVVLLSEMQPFNSVLGRKAISGAEVFLNENNGPWHKLQEIQQGRYILDGMRGIPGNTYGLLINYAGESYQANSTMPDLVRIDSTGISTNTFDDSRRTPLVLYQDPPNIKNYYYFQLRINGIASSSLFIYNDKFSDGKSVLQNLDDFSLSLKDGDSVVVELRNIDEEGFNYWKGVQSQSGTSASPGNPPSNLSNGALGYFSAFAANSVYFNVD